MTDKHEKFGVLETNFKQYYLNNQFFITTRLSLKKVQRILKPSFCFLNTILSKIKVPLWLLGNVQFNRPFMIKAFKITHKDRLGAAQPQVYIHCTEESLLPVSNSLSCLCQPSHI